MRSWRLPVVILSCAVAILAAMYFTDHHGGFNHAVTRLFLASFLLGGWLISAQDQVNVLSALPIVHKRLRDADEENLNQIIALTRHCDKLEVEDGQLLATIYHGRSEQQDYNHSIEAQIDEVARSIDKLQVRVDAADTTRTKEQEEA